MGSIRLGKMSCESIVIPSISFLIFLSLNCQAAKSSNPATTVNASSIIYETIGRTLHLPEIPNLRLRRPGRVNVRSQPPSSLQTNNGRKRETNELPLQKLFPEIAINTTYGTPELTSALLNHSIHHGSDDELDRLVFSKLPEGSKLILRTVKIVKTDEDGNEEPMGEPAISFDVVSANSTEGDDEFESETNEDDASPEQDLETDASSHHKASHESYGTNEKTKDKTDSYHHGQDHAQKHKKTLTDSEGKKVTNYKGAEKGLTDYDNSHGNAQSNEGERFKNSKKKNKGRKVTGFKRVYHKEEFQRTEHFYDDEEAKKIAESYGLADAKEKSEHGKKDDKRKYHGTRVEHTDGEKVKNEHSTENGHHKGQHTSHESSDKHRQSQHYNQQQQQQQRTPNYYYQAQHHQQHPNHNYQAAYSNTRTKKVPSEDQHVSPTAGSSTGSAPVNQIALPGPEVEPRIPFAPRRRIPNRRRVKSHPIPVKELERNLLPPEPLPSEKKIYFAQRDHSVPMELSYYYAPNFGPVPSGDADLLTGYHQGNIGAGEDQNLITEFYNKMGNASEHRFNEPLLKMNVDDRYARNYPAPGPTSLDAPPDYYSTILKMNTAGGPNYPYTLQQILGNNLISVDKATGTKVATETFYPPKQQATGNRNLFNQPYSNWTPIQSGSSNAALNSTLVASNTEISSTTEAAYPRNLTKNITPGGFHEFPGYHHDNVRHPHRTPPIGRPLFNQRPRFRRPPNGRFRLGHGQHPPGHNALRGNGHYSGKRIVPQDVPQELTELSPPLQNSHPPPQHNRRPPIQQVPSFPQFMNGLMNSVSEFFTRLG